MSTTTFWRTLVLVAGLCLVTLGLAVPVQAATYQTFTPKLPHVSRQDQPTAQSVLIVLLDRSGSLAQTDPNEYSTSIAKVLADLWPGKMAVIFFSGESSPLPQTSLVDLTLSGARDSLKNQIEAQRNTVGGDTPTQEAIEQAENVLANQNYPTGSRVVLITDGQPDISSDPNGQKQIQAIVGGPKDDASIFAAHNVPISTFGLGNQVPSYAQTFLQNLAKDTGGEFNDVTDPAQLAPPVVKMAADWQSLKFVPTNGKNTFFIDTYAKQVDFITFTQDSTTYPVTLQGASGQTIPDQAFQPSSPDVHYVLQSLTVSQFNPSGNYTIHSGDPNVQAYALEQTRLQVEIVTPTPQTAVYAFSPHSVTITAALYDNNNPQQHVFPHAGDAVAIGINFTLTAQGKTVDSGEETLTQEASPHDDLFSTHITPKETGTLTITVSATYQFIPVPNHPSITLPVTIAPPPPCALTDPQCVIQQYGVGIGSTLLALLLLFAALWWFTRPTPFGILINTDGYQRILGNNRALGRSFLHKSTLFSDELRGFAWAGASFELRFKRGHHVHFVARNKTAQQEIACVVKQENQAAPVGKEIILHNGDQIIANNQTCATFYESRTRAQQTEQAWL